MPASSNHLFAAADRLNLQSAGVFTAITALLSNIVRNVPAVMVLKSLVPSFHDPQTGWLVLASRRALWPAT